MCKVIELITKSHPSTLNHKFRLVNPRIINIFYFSLKMRVKTVNVNMKSGTMNIIFLTINYYATVHNTKKKKNCTQY